jgi:anaerobic ribonucleoside-triphosphate reductase
MARIDCEIFERSFKEVNKPYSTLQLTNSSLPLNSRLSIEAEFQRKLSGGHTLIIEHSALEKGDIEYAFHLTERALKEFRIQSIAYSIKKVMCLYCGFVIDGDSTRCKNCGSTTKLFTPISE